MTLTDIIKKHKSTAQALAVTGAIILTSNAISYFQMKERLTYSNCYFTNQKLMKYESQPMVNKFFNYGSKIAIDNKLNTLDCKNI